MRRKLDLLNCDSWDKLPDVWKVVKKVKAVDYKNDIADKNLFNIVKEYFSDDYLRPATMGAYVENESITVTDSYMLLNIPFNTSLETGVYRLNPKTQIKDTKMYELVKDVKYVSYRDVLGNSTTTHKISVYKLKTYIQAVFNGKYSNRVTNAINFKFDKDTNIAFNGKFLLSVLDSFLLMGFSELYVCIDGSKMYFSPNQETAKNPLKNIGKHPFALVMKLFFDGGLGAYEMDFGTELTSYYCFECDKIFNADGSVANFDINLQNTDLPYMNSEHLKLISKVLPKNPKVWITENIKVENTVATVTNLNYFLKVKDVFVEDGIYEVCNGALKNTEYVAVDFPKFNINEKKQIAKLNTEELSQRVSQALPFVADDNLRPSLEAICLKIGMGLQKQQNKVIATNSHILYIAYITNELENKNGESDKEYLVEEPKYMSYFLNAVKDESVVLFEYNNKAKLGFISDDIELSINLVDAKPPSYESVIDTNINTIMDFDTEELYNVLNSLKGDDLKSDVYLDFESNDRDRGYFKIKLSKYNQEKREKEIVKDLNIKIGCTFKPMQQNDINNKSIGLIMPIGLNDKNISFNIKYLKSFISVTDGAFYFDNRKDMPQYIAKLSEIEMKRKNIAKNIQKQEPKVKQPTKSEVQDTIDALKFLADAGNEDAKNTIESLKFLI